MEAGCRDHRRKGGCVKLSWQDWLLLAADKSTYSDQVYNILYDWREERERLIKERAQFERKLEELTQLMVSAHNTIEDLKLALKQTSHQLLLHSDALNTATRDE